MTHSTRVQLAQEELIAKNAQRIAGMAQTTNAMKLEGKFPHVASAMDKFLRDLVSSAPRNNPISA